MSTNSVLIVGGGPLGLLQALGLAQIGVEVTVLAPGPERQPVTRTLVFNWSMMAGLDHLGILDEMMAVGVVQHAVSLNVLRTGERIVFDLSALSADVEHAFTLNMEQGQFVDILLTHLAASSAVTIEWDTRIVSLDQGKDGCTVVAAGVDGEITRRVGWVVGADGTRSVVRRQLGLGFPGLTWPERFVAVNLRFDFSTMGIKEAATHIDPDRGALIAQIDRTGLWSYLYAENERLPEESIEARMQAVFADVLPDGADPRVESWVAHRMHQRVADTFRVGRVLLVGGAAHVTAPTSGFGLVGSFFDVLAATEVLGAMASGEADEVVLDRYADDRRRVFTEITSPISSDTKMLIFNGSETGRLERELTRYRAAAASRASVQEFLLLAGELASPSLLASP
ncbi:MULTISPECIES: FAD-dependent oxidoreductase [Rhodococcus]|uniref:FAD-dependent monooxygenase n=1 Tax=Rhodococcus qingshengii JCM 15477 TaxID=1303681 RepID=A0AB38RM73_RHOSG|nr:MULTISPECIES: FAD-dependent monooxygenase [Rhodococcus]MDA3635152.1 FAD-dependent monooxygenase [Rhodococcus sp. C-2]UPU46502.1 FAD-dependent monooxygenase [Rhodococcus qingshengii JCM 15477]